MNGFFFDRDFFVYLYENSEVAFKVDGDGELNPSENAPVVLKARMDAYRQAND